MSDPILIGGRYQQGELIGRGGMGDVFIGADTVSGDPVAIKRLHPHIVQENPSILDRFQREGQALSQLNHPNIVKMLAAVQENDYHYLVMEYIGGGSLRELIDREKRMPVKRVLNIALDLADALTRAHRLSIIHRDIKPDNVLMKADGTPCLTDFGVAHMGDRTRLTQTGSVIGTYAYLSPEACNGMELDERADIWSFGVMLFEMLAGRPPFHENSTPAVLTAILTKPAPDLNRLRDDIPPALSALITHMLEKDRDRRISSVRVVGAELEALLRGLDTPLQGLLGPGDAAVLSRRFITPSEEQRQAAMEAQPPPKVQTHGLSSIYPAPGTPPPPYQYPPPGTPLTPGMTPGYPPGMMTPPEYLAQRSNKWQWITVMVAVIVLSLATVAIVSIVTLLGDDTPDTPRLAQETSTQISTEIAAVQTAARVEPVAPGDYMVLIAPFEEIGGIEQIAGVRRPAVTRFIADELRQTLEVSAPFSHIKVRDYPEEIGSREEALAVAEANGATIVIWGSYTSTAIEAEVQIGVFNAFPHLNFERETLERAINVRLSLTDERHESLAPYVLNALSLLQNAGGEAFETMRTLAISDLIQVRPAQIASTSASALTHQALLDQFENPEAAVAALDQALALDPGNALYYVLRATLQQRLQNPDEALRDVETATRIGPEGWTMPLMVLANISTNVNEIFDVFDRIIAQRPDDWLALFFRGSIAYQTLRFDIARADFEAAIALSPDANFPYVYAALLALREGRVADAAAAVDVILREYPDASFMNRLLTATFGENTRNSYGTIVASFSSLVLGRYQDAVDAARTGLVYFANNADLFLVEGLASCSLGSNLTADRAYSQAIARAPDHVIAYVLRAETRLKRGETEAAEADFEKARALDSTDTLEPLIEAIRARDVGCQNFFSSANPLLAG
jgi:serine/threonine protein kinase/tetratricopeptide (TPR) repeat protein